MRILKNIKEKLTGGLISLFGMTNGYWNVAQEEMYIFFSRRISQNTRVKHLYTNNTYGALQSIPLTGIRKGTSRNVHGATWETVQRQ